jgi:uncharacterized protein YktA (UPF0223 family)
MNDFEYETHDLNLATYLQTSGKKLVDVRKQGKDRAVFVFLDVKDEDIQAYFNREDDVRAMDLLNNLKNLKSMVYTKLGDKRLPKNLNEASGESLRFRV